MKNQNFLYINWIMPTSTAEFPPSTSEPLIFPKIWFLLFPLHFWKFLPFIDPLAKMQSSFKLTIDVLHSYLKKYNEKLIFNYLKKSFLKEFISNETYLNFNDTKILHLTLHHFLDFINIFTAFIITLLYFHKN